MTGRGAAEPGTGVELTLDTQLQYESEQALAQAIEIVPRPERYGHRRWT